MSFYRVALSRSYCSTCGRVQRGVLEYEADAQGELFTVRVRFFLALTVLAVHHWGLRAASAALMMVPSLLSMMRVGVMGDWMT